MILLQILYGFLAFTGAIFWLFLIVIAILSQGDKWEVK